MKKILHQSLFFRIFSFLWIVTSSWISAGLGISHLGMYQGIELARFTRKWSYGFNATFWSDTIAKARAFQPDDENTGLSNGTLTSVLQLFQNDQNFFAVQRGFSSNAPTAPLFVIDEDNSAAQVYPQADLMGSGLYSIVGYNHPRGLGVQLIVPWYHFSLKNVRWFDRRCGLIYPEDFYRNTNLESVLERAGFEYGPWRRNGVGDVILDLFYERHYPQRRQFIQNVKLGLDGGVRFPTGRKNDPFILFGFPFGVNSGGGVVLGGFVEVDFPYYLTLSADARFNYLFGTVEERRIQTDPAQTDLLFPKAMTVYTDPGFMQFYMLSAAYNLSRWIPSSSLRIAYTYTKQSETRLFLSEFGYDPFIYNESESLQEWTTHTINIIANATIPLTALSIDQSLGVSFFIKHGFNGKRAILFDTLGLALSIYF